MARHDRARGELAEVDMLDTRGQTKVVPDPSGRYVSVTDESNTAYLYDVETRLLNHYDGSAGQPSCVTAPTPAFDHVLVGDVNGTVRVWDPPSRAAQVVLQAPSGIFALVFTPDSAAVVTGGDQVVQLTRLADRRTTALVRYDAMVYGVRAARSGSVMMSYSYDGTAHAWRAAHPERARRFTEHGSLVEDVDILDEERVVSVGDDGRLLVWSPDGAEAEVLFEHPRPITAVEVLGRGRIVVKDADGWVWEMGSRRQQRMIRVPDGADVTVLRASPDGAYLAIGTDRGAVTILRSSDWSVVRTLAAGGGIRQIQFDPKSRDVLVAAEARQAHSGRVHVVELDGHTRFGWRSVPASVRDVAYAPDGDTIGFVCSDGGTWLYATSSDAWVYTRDHETDTFVGRFSPDGRWFASSDRRGTVIVRDVAATFADALRSISVAGRNHEQETDPE